MIGVWYSVRGDRPAHWHERITRPDGTTFWAALSRCGMSHVLPSMLADKWEWMQQNAESPDMDRVWTCASCRRNRRADQQRKKG